MLMAGVDDLDIALVDIMMPRLSGDEVLRQFRAWEAEARPETVYSEWSFASSDTYDAVDMVDAAYSRPDLHAIGPAVESTDC